MRSQMELGCDIPRERRSQVRGGLEALSRNGAAGRGQLWKREFPSWEQDHHYNFDLIWHVSRRGLLFPIRMGSARRGTRLLARPPASLVPSAPSAGRPTLPKDPSPASATISLVREKRCHGRRRAGCRADPCEYREAAGCVRGGCFRGYFTDSGDQPKVAHGKEISG